VSGGSGVGATQAFHGIAKAIREVRDDCSIADEGN